MRIFKSLTVGQEIVLGLISGAYLGSVFVFVYIFFDQGIFQIKNLDLGQIGSFLGGVFSPILFLYITIQHFSQQKQILDEKRKEVEKEEEKTRLAQPFFEFKNNIVKQIYGGDAISIEFNILNHASDATNISIRVLQDESNEPFYNKKISKLPSNETDTIRIDFNYFYLEIFDIEVRYFDSLRLPNVKLYSCQKIQHDEYDTSFPFKVIEKK